VAMMIPSSSLIFDSDIDEFIVEADLVTMIVSGQQYVCDGRTSLTEPWLVHVRVEGRSGPSCT